MLCCEVPTISSAMTQPKLSSILCPVTQSHMNFTPWRGGEEGGEGREEEGGGGGRMEEGGGRGRREEGVGSN